MKIKIFSILLLISSIHINALTTTLIIPCHSAHAKYLYNLLRIYENQTDPPNEIVISLSDSNNVETGIINLLENNQWIFPIKLIQSKQKLFAGQNRNIACKHASNEIFICQDADDIPHPQRIEVIKYFFNKLQLDFLLHKFIYNNESLPPVGDMSTIHYSYLKTYHDAWAVGYMLFGQPAIHRRVFDKIKWKDIPIDEDNTFANQVITTFNNCIMIKSTLYIYRLELSTTPYELYKNNFLSKRRLTDRKQRYKIQIFEL
jgi:hypothetical protein